LGEELKRKAHLILGIGAVLAILRPSVDDMIAYIILAALGSLIPDLDLKYKHRKTLHNIFIPPIITLGLTLALSKALTLNPIYIYLAIIIAWLSHIIGDLFTVGGVAMLWPLKSKRIRLLKLRYDHPIVSTIGLALGILGIAMWLYFKILKGII